MFNLNQKGVIHFIVLLILLGGIIAGVWLVTAGPLKLFPKATVSGPITPQTSFILFADPKADFQVGSEIPVELQVRSDIDPANLFSARINFDKNILQVQTIMGDLESVSGSDEDEQVTVERSFIKNWVEQQVDNDSGQIFLTGGVPSPGYQTNTNQPASRMATIIFRAKAKGIAEITFDNTSAIYRDSDNLNILGPKRDLKLAIGIEGGGVIPTGPSPSPVTKPPVSAPIPSCSQGSGDGNGDGKVNLADLSILLSDFNKTAGFRKGVDMNGDCKINTLDYSLLRNLLIEKKVIKG